jgi:Spy/CpxP family protein refolding chaperone
MLTWKKSWARRGLMAVLGGAVLFGTLSAYGHAPCHGGPMSEADMTRLSERLVERASSKLSLDAAQQSKLKALAEVLQQQRLALKGSPTSPHEALQGLMAGAQFDRSGAQTLVDAKLATLHSGAPAVIQALADFFDSLQPAQQTQLRELLAHGGSHHFWRG